VHQQISQVTPLDLSERHPPIVVMPMLEWTRVSRAGLQFAFSICWEIYVLHVTTKEDDQEFLNKWRKAVEEPVRKAGERMPKLEILNSPYRFVISPIVDFVLKLEEQNPGRQIAVIIPEFVEKHWYHNFLHNRRATWLKAALLLKGNQRIVIINVPWYLEL
jgi:hypothetical protein